MAKKKSAGERFERALQNVKWGDNTSLSEKKVSISKIRYNDLLNIEKRFKEIIDIVVK